MINLIGYWVVTTTITYVLLLWPLFISMLTGFSAITYVRSNASYTERFKKWVDKPTDWWAVPLFVMSFIALCFTFFFWFFVIVAAAIANVNGEPVKFGIEWMQGFIHSGSMLMGPVVGWLAVFVLSLIGCLKGMRLLYRMNLKVQKLLNKENK